MKFRIMLSLQAICMLLQAMLGTKLQAQRATVATQVIERIQWPGRGLNVTDRPVYKRNLRQSPTIARTWEESVINSFILNAEGVNVNQL